MRVREMCHTALMTALMCIAAPLTVPIGPVPVSMATLAVYLAGALLGARRGMATVGLYILIGAVGLPVFSGFRSGLHQLAGVTGGTWLGICFAQEQSVSALSAGVGRNGFFPCPCCWVRCCAMRQV